MPLPRVISIRGHVLIGYINGAQDGTNSSGNGTGYASNTNPLNIGNDSVTAGRKWNGNIGDARYYNSVLTPAVIAEIADPAKKFELWYPLRSKKWISIAAVGGTVALTGNSTTASVGAVVPSLTLGITGNSATASVGTVTPSITIALTGNSVTTAVGSVAPGLTVPLTGKDRKSVV